MESDDPTTNLLADVDHDAIVVSIAGEIDMAREGELLAVLEVLDPPPDTVIEVDLGEVSFMDSAGLRGLLRAQAYLSGRSCQLHVRRPSRQVVKVIELIGIRSMLTFVDGSDDGGDGSPAG
jgi:anti-anti-sigma factor